jgi:hypothetical protein
MARSFGRNAPALVIACVALFAALGGSVYAAKRINGHSIKVKSLPGNRLAIGSVPGNRLRPGAIAGTRIAPGSITGAQIDSATLAKVPSAVHADSADSAADAGTALLAVSAEEARKVNGRVAGCGGGFRQFAGSCWETKPRDVAVEAPKAAKTCATVGGELPSALALVAFIDELEIEIAPGDEWSRDVTNVSTKNVYGVVTVSPSREIDSVISTSLHKYRCVIPLVH